MRVYDHKQLKPGDFVFFKYERDTKSKFDYGIIVGPECEHYGVPVKWFLDPMEQGIIEHIDHIPDMYGKLYIVKRDVKFNGLIL